MKTKKRRWFLVGLFALLVLQLSDTSSVVESRSFIPGGGASGGAGAGGKW